MAPWGKRSSSWWPIATHIRRLQAGEREGGAREHRRRKLHRHDKGTGSELSGGVLPDRRAGREGLVRWAIKVDVQRPGCGAKLGVDQRRRQAAAAAADWIARRLQREGSHRRVAPGRRLRGRAKGLQFRSSSFIRPFIMIWRGMVTTNQIDKEGRLKGFAQTVIVEQFGIVLDEERRVRWQDHHQKGSDDRT